MTNLPSTRARQQVMIKYTNPDTYRIPEFLANSKPAVCFDTSLDICSQKNLTFCCIKVK